MSWAKGIRHALLLFGLSSLFFLVSVAFFAEVGLLLGGYVLSSPRHISFLLDQFFGLKLTTTHYEKKQHGIYTDIKIENLRIVSFSDGHPKELVFIQNMDISLDLWNSFFHRVPVFEHILLNKGVLDSVVFQHSSRGFFDVESKKLLRILNFQNNIEILNFHVGKVENLNFHWRSVLKPSGKFSHHYIFSAIAPRLFSNELQVSGMISGDLTHLNTIDLKTSVKVSGSLEGSFALRPQSGGRGSDYDLRLPLLDFSKFSSLDDVFPSAWSPTFWKSLNFKGSLLNVKSMGRIQGKRLWVDQIQGTFSEVSFDPVQKMPGASHLNACFEGSQLAGHLKIWGQDIVIHSPVWFSSAWDPMSMNAEFEWSMPVLGNPSMVLQSFKASTESLTLTASGKWDITPQGIEHSTLEILSDLEGKNLTQSIINPYLPRLVIRPNLYEWLTHAIVSVGSVSNHFHVAGKLNELGSNPSGLEIRDTAEIHEGRLIPWEGWPQFDAIEGTLLFDRTLFSAEVTSARVFDSKVGRVHLEVPDFSPGRPSFFSVEGEANPSGEDLGSYIVNSPLKNDLPLFKHLDISGQVRLGLHLTFPLGHPNSASSPDIQGTLSFVNNQLQFKEFPVPMKNFTGNIHFNGLTLNALSPLNGEVLNRPWEMSFFPKHIEISGDFDFSELAKMKKEDAVLSHISGVAPVMVNVDLTRALDIGFKSYLKMVQLDLPPPFFKPKGRVFPLRGRLQESQDQLGHKMFTGNFALGALLNGECSWTDDGNFNVYALFHRSWFQEIKNPFNPYLTFSEFKSFPDSPLKQKVLIQGRVSDIDLGAWMLMLKNYFLGHQNELASFPIQTDVDVSVGLLKFFSEQYSNVQLGLFGQPKEPFLTTFDGKFIRGKILFSDPIEAKFNVLALFSKQNNRNFGFNEGSDKSDFLMPDRLSQLSAIWIDIDHLYWDNSDKGSLKFFLFPIPDGVAIRNGHWGFSTLISDFSGDYVLKDKQPFTSLSAQIHGTDFGAALDRLGFPSKLNKTDGSILFSGYWKGGIFPEIKTLNGLLGLELFHGTLKEIDSPALSRLLGFFSIESLGKHLRLNFSDMKEKGFVFSQISGVYIIDQGVATTGDLFINGPTLRADLSGEIDLVNKTVNQTVVALPNIDGGIALAAGLIGGPIVGVMAWAADKVLMDTVLKNRGIVYPLKGTW
jgi:uncharacterized protein YhdP